MRMRKGLLMVIVLMAVTIAALSLATSRATAEPVKQPAHQGQGNCLTGSNVVKDEDGSDGWEITAPAGAVFVEGKVKAGTPCFGNGEKYQITGFGTGTLTAVRLCEEGPDCKEISNLVGRYADPTATPSDTPEVPTDTPTPDPTQTPTDGPSPTATATPEVSLTPTNTGEPTNTPRPQPTPTDKPGVPSGGEGPPQHSSNVFLLAIAVGTTIAVLAGLRRRSLG